MFLNELQRKLFLSIKFFAKQTINVKMLLKIQKMKLFLFEN